LLNIIDIRKVILFKNESLKLILILLSIIDLIGCKDNVVNPPILETNYPYLDNAPAWSPDGTKIIYFHQGIDTLNKSGIYHINQDSTGLWIINLNNGTTKQFLKGQNMEYPDISPDGNWIVYNDGNQIYKIDTTGENPSLLWQNGLYPRWTDDGNKIIYQGSGGDTTGTFIMNPDGTNNRYIYPALNPSGSSSPNIFCGIKYYSKDNSSLSIIDTSGNVIKDIFIFSYKTTIRYTHWSFSNNLIAFEWQNTSTIIPTVWTINSNNNQYQNLITEGSISPRWSDDGNKIAYVKFDSRIYDKNNGTIWIANADGSNKKQITRGLN